MLKTSYSTIYKYHKVEEINHKNNVEIKQHSNFFKDSKDAIKNAFLAKSTEEFYDCFNDILIMSSPEYLYKFALYFYQTLTMDDIRVIYSSLVKCQNEIYIQKFIKDVLPKIQTKDREDLKENDL